MILARFENIRCQWKLEMYQDLSAHEAAGIQGESRKISSAEELRQIEMEVEEWVANWKVCGTRETMLEVLFQGGGRVLCPSEKKGPFGSSWGRVQEAQTELELR